MIGLHFELGFSLNVANLDVRFGSTTDLFIGLQKCPLSTLKQALYDVPKGLVTPSVLRLGWGQRKERSCGREGLAPYPLLCAFTKSPDTLHIPIFNIQAYLHYSGTNHGAESHHL